ncbi:MAG: MATE family efflux transporter [Mangrovibacterium sp.]
MTLLKKYFLGYHDPGGIRELLVIALPMIISTACDGVMTFTDRLFLARVDSVQMNAAMGGGVAMQMLIFFFVGLTGYSTALVAQYFGAGEKHNSTKAAFQAILITLFAWPVVLLLKPLVIEFFYFMKLPESQISFQVQYLNILVWGGIFGMLRYTLGCYFTGIGKTKIVMTATIVAMLVNVILDYILIFGKLGFPPMEIKGAAIATVSGLFCAVIILVIAYLGPVNRKVFLVLKSFRLDMSIMKRLIYYGSPAGFELFLNFLAFSFMIALFQSEGDVVATATTIMFNWDLVSFIPLLGIEIGVTSLVGRYMGAGKPHIAYQAAMSAIKTGMFYSVVILALFVFVPGWLVHVFRPETQSAVFDEAVPLAVSMIKIAALYVLAEAVMVALVGTLRGAGDTYFTMIASVLAHWSFVPLLYLGLKVFHFSVSLSWFLLVVFFLLFCCILVIRFRQGKWKTMRVIE